MCNYSAYPPNVIEIKDEEDNIRRLITNIDKVIKKAGCGAIITIEKAEIIRYITKN